MADLPPGMYQGERHPVPQFHPEEYLYRRVPPDFWEEHAARPIDIDAIELPDMSVGRSRFAHPEWLRLATGADDWAVVGFKVEEIPPEKWIDGIRYDFRAVHVPHARNYPHTEIQAFEHENDVHVDGKTVLLPDRVHLEWRERLLRKIRIFLRVCQDRTIRQDASTSHVPE
jgi:hypothetical protein